MKYAFFIFLWFFTPFWLDTIGWGKLFHISRQAWHVFRDGMRESGGGSIWKKCCERVDRRDNISLSHFSYSLVGAFKLMKLCSLLIRFFLLWDLKWVMQTKRPDKEMFLFARLKTFYIILKSNLTLTSVEFFLGCVQPCEAISAVGPK